MLRLRLLAGFFALLLLMLGVGGYAVWLMHSTGQSENVAQARELNRIFMVRELENLVAHQERMAHNHLSDVAESDDAIAAWSRQRNRVADLAKKLEKDASIVRGAGDPMTELVRQMEVIQGHFSRMEGEWGDRTAFSGEIPEMQKQAQELSIAADKIMTASEKQLSTAGESAARLRWESSRFMIATLAIAVGIFAYMAFVISRAVIRPIRDMTHCIREIASGHLDQKLEISSNDELREMADAFNTMAAELRAHRKKSTDELLRAHQLLQTTLATFPDPIFVLSDPGRIAFQNPAGKRLLTELDLIGELPAAIKRRHDRVFATGQDFLPTTLTEANYYRIHDQAHYFLTRMLAMRRDDGVVSGVIVAMQDVTRLRLMDEIKTNHLATLSHELKTPLTSLQLALELLGEDKGNTLTLRHQEIITSARGDAERLVERLHDILDLSKFQASTHGNPSGPNATPPDPHRRPSLARRLTTRIVSLRDGERHG